MPDLINLVGRTVIVTGASSGIGASAARLLHAAGAYPVLAARRADLRAGPFGKSWLNRYFASFASFVPAGWEGH
jgi:NAD(P)-dependent dehydrogenase (short-subunit alcohol dehydrogenase family)